MKNVVVNIIALHIVHGTVDISALMLMKPVMIIAQYTVIAKLVFCDPNIT